MCIVLIILGTNTQNYCVLSDLYIFYIKDYDIK